MCVGRGAGGARGPRGIWISVTHAAVRAWRISGATRALDHTTHARSAAHVACSLHSHPAWARGRACSTHPAPPPPPRPTFPARRHSSSASSHTCTWCKPAGAPKGSLAPKPVPTLGPPSTPPPPPSHPPEGVPTRGSIACLLMQLAFSISRECMQCPRQLVPSAPTHPPSRPPTLSAGPCRPSQPSSGCASSARLSRRTSNRSSTYSTGPAGLLPLPLFAAAAPPAAVPLVLAVVVVASVAAALAAAVLAAMVCRGRGALRRFRHSLSAATRGARTWGLGFRRQGGSRFRGLGFGGVGL